MNTILHITECAMTVIFFFSRKSRSQREQRKKEVEVAQEKKEEEEEEKEEVYVVPSDSQFCKYVEEIMEKIHPLTSTREQILALSL